MNYEYLATLPNGNLRYKITLNLYRDCFQSNVELDDEIDLGVYINNNDNDRYTIATFKLLVKKYVNPPGTATCDFYKENVCIEYGLYEGNIDLPPSSVGYHLTFARCCRNQQTNIPDNGNGTPFQGQTYYCFIPDNLYENSSPVFSGVPSPYMCARDTTTFDFSAYDPDGDELSYELVHPYVGASLTNSVPTPPDNFTGIPLVAFNAGYTYLKPFGTSNGSISTVNSITGLTTFMAPASGSYIVAIEVTEKRNGVVLSKVRMDLQILVLNCPPNDRPQINAPDGQSFIIEEGETLCFDVTASDPDGDLVTFDVKGPIYDGSNNYNGPRATFTADDGKTNASGEFCWTPDCDQDRPEPYVIRITAADDGCPPKFNTLDFTINVTPFVGSDSIEGPREVCRYNQYNYTAVNGQANSTFDWEVDDGYIVGTDDGSTITVYWDGAGPGKIRMTEISQYGCPGDEVEIDVSIVNSPPLPVITGKDTVCELEAGLNYQVGSNAGSTYEWWAFNATISAQNQNQITIGTYNPPFFTLRAVETNSVGCPSDTATFEVYVSAPDPAVIGPQTVCPNASNVAYISLMNFGSTYSWSVTGGTIASGVGTNEIRVDWGNSGVGTVSVQETNRHGCVSNTNVIIVNKTYVLIANPIFGPNSVCENEIASYETLEINGSVYNWDITGGTQLSGDSSYMIDIQWGAPGAARVGVQEKAWDPVNSLECLSPFTYLDVTINPKPIANEIVGIYELCQFEDSITYWIDGYPDSDYEWAIDGDTNNIVGQGKQVIKIFWDQAGSFVLSVRETTAAGCQGVLIDSVVVVHPKPNTSPISGPVTICPEDALGKVYSVNGFPTSTYNWALGGENSFSGQRSSSVTVDWETTIPNGYLQVVEVSQYGCLGDTQELLVDIDRLNIDLRFISVGTPDNRMIIDWQLEELSSASDFTIQRRDAGTIAWTDVITVAGGVFNYTELDINTDANAFDYRVISTNSCGTLISSEIHTSILLQGYQDENFNINIAFSDYQGWDNGVLRYEIVESINNGPFTQTGLSPLPRENTLILNNVEEFKKCYRVIAYELDGERTNSWSNEVCFTFEPTIYVPSAFTPNNDNLNDAFGIVGLAVKDVTIEIYNRWGERIYEGFNLDDKWDATYLGKAVPMGTYLYLIKYSDFEDKIYQRSGTINLIR
ncbi:MAG: gliding motility-associated C-terminal domain-containing protein [Bacteroidia bacterium]